MSELTQEQENAMATLKGNLHLPGGGFHLQIVELSREFLLPFQTVRSALKKAQRVIEKKIKQDFANLDESELSKEHWLSIIKNNLTEQAENNRPIMDTLAESDAYRNATQLIADAIKTEDERAQTLDELAMAYEFQVYKPLMAMLYTTTLYWELSDDLMLMNADVCAKFSGYPQHAEAILHLLQLRDQTLNTVIA
ncbi:hypothetical protein BCU68_02990 [Vibrio sp. 10N.286.49.B3]|uniref:hypothetical protein n=1 Tax=Vibrio sp. 10N.286.49.B3 TaxID=1880855 RepID=UPI000C818861|nr:hypothetical protein [Vibrio sp. 10N.286.49.B3]PMH44483.1 hypothetical protein BCU68_02990 [Vibrio sp. 10N.286.49.B3]